MKHNRYHRKKSYDYYIECLLLVKIFQILKHILHTHNLRTNILSSFLFTNLWFTDSVIKLILVFCDIA